MQDQPKQPKRPKPRWRRWLRRLVLSVLALVTIVVAAVLVVLDTSWGLELLRSKVVMPQLAKAFPGGAKIGAIEGHIVGDLIVRDVELDTPDGKPMVTIGTVRVNLGPLALFRHALRLDSFEVDDVAVTIRPKPATTEPAPPEPDTDNAAPSSPSAWSIELPSLAIHRGRFTLEKPDGTTEQVTGLDVEALVELLGNGAGIRAIGSVAAQWRGAPIELGFTAHQEGDEIVVPIARARAGAASLIAIGVTLHGTNFSGTLAAELPAATAQALAGVQLPGDASVQLDTLPGGVMDARVKMTGDLPFDLRALVRTDVDHRSARGFAYVEDTDLAAATAGALNGHGAFTIAFDAGLDGKHGMHLRGMAGTVAALGPKGSPAHGSILFDLTRKGGEVVASLSGVGATLGVSAVLARQKGVLKLTSSLVDVRVRDLGDLTREAESHAALDGAVVARVRASGALLPETDLEVNGSVEVEGLHANALTAKSVQVGIENVHAAMHGGTVRITADTRLAVEQLASGGSPIGSMTLGARAQVGSDGNVIVDLEHHQISLATGAVWAGAGGRIAITPERIDVSGVSTGVNGAAALVAASAKIARATGDLTAKADVHDVPLTAFAAQLGGTLAATVAVARTNGHWSGSGTVHAKKAVVAAGAPPVDVDGDLAIVGRRVTVHGAASGEMGAVALVLDVDGPRELTDARGWKALDHRAIREASVTFKGLDLGKLAAAAPPKPNGDRSTIEGTIDGELALDKESTLHVRGLPGPNYLPTSADITITPSGSTGTEAVVAVVANVEGIGGGDVRADVSLPAHVFDPAAWKALGATALRGATIDVRDLPIDPGMLAKLHVTGPWSAKLVAHVDVEPAAAGARFTTDLVGIHGGPIAKPMDAHLTGAFDAGGASADFALAAGKMQLVQASVRSPLTPDRVAAAKTTTLSGTVTIPELNAKDLLPLLGRSGALGGSLGGAITIAGTIGTPTAKIDLHATDLSVPSSVTGRPPATLEKLAITGTWGGASGQLAVIGTEANGATLRLEASGKPTDPSSIRATIDAKQLDIGPLAQLAPGPLGGASGMLDASLELIGLDDKGNVRGGLHLSDARLPIAPVIGTMRKAKIDVTIADHQVKATLAGKLGQGDVSADASVVLDGVLPKTVDAHLQAVKISLIRALQPILDGQVTAHLTRTGTKWNGEVGVQHAHVVIPTHGGSGLLVAGAPSDMTFVDAPPPKASIFKRPPPEDPWLTTKIKIGSTTIEDVELQVRASAAGALTVTYGGDALGVDGEIDIDRGDIEWAGRLYQVDHANVSFDGSVDPLLDARIVHDFPDLTLAAEVNGRASEPSVVFTSDPGGHTQSELLGFFLGGDPSADQSSQAQQAAAGLASAWFNTAVGNKLNQAISHTVGLNVHFSYNYEAETSTSSQAVRLGTWLTKKWYVAYREHLEARPDENTGEVETEYHLPWGMLLQGNYGDRGYAGGDMILLHLHW